MVHTRSGSEFIDSYIEHTPSSKINAPRNSLFSTFRRNIQPINLTNIFHNKPTTPSAQSDITVTDKSKSTTQVKLVQEKVVDIIVHDLDIMPQKTTSTSVSPQTTHTSKSMLSLNSDGTATDKPIDENKALSPAESTDLTGLKEGIIAVCQDKELASTAKVDDMTLVKTVHEMKEKTLEGQADAPEIDFLIKLTSIVPSVT